MRALKITTHDYEQISAYLDGQLSSHEKVHFEQQMRERPDLKNALEEMSSTRALLRMAPRRRAPRNFTLTPAMVQQGKQKRSFGFNLFPALSFASAMAALILVATVLFELMPGASRATTASDAGAQTGPMADTTTLMQQEMPTVPAGAEEQNAAPSIAAAPEDAGEIPPAITWGNPAYSDPYGSSIMGKGGGPEMDSIGRGGGGGGVDVPGMGGGAPDGNLVVPLDGAASLPTQSEAEASGARQNFDHVPTLEGTGPILGLPSADQAGQIATPLPTAFSGGDLSSPAQNETGPAVVQSENIPALRIVQIALGVLALVTGLAAFVIWRRNR